MDLRSRIHLLQEERSDAEAEAELDALIREQFTTPITYIDDDDLQDTYCFRLDRDVTAGKRRQGRKYDADYFRRRFSYGSSIEPKTFIWPGGIHPWKDKSSGTIWVGVHGLDSICVVTRIGDLDLTRVHRDYKYLTIETVLRKFRKTVISEIEDLASPSSNLRERFGGSIPKPFGVVSANPHNDNDHKDSGHEASSDENEEDGEDEEVEGSKVSNDECESNEKKVARLMKALLKKDKEKCREALENKGQKIPGYDEKKTIKFLREQMRMDATLSKSNQVSGTEYDEIEAINFLLKKMKTMTVEAFTVDETIKAAISAFQHLFQKEFKAEEIGVTVLDPKYSITFEEAKYKDIYVKELETSEIQYHLDAINMAF